MHARFRRLGSLFVMATVWLSTALPASAQSWTSPAAAPPPSRAWAPPPRVIVPQIGRAAGTACSLEVTSVAAKVSIAERVATTTLEVGLANRSGANQEATLLLPVPANATVTGFAFEGAASEPTAQLLSRDDARREYDAIVARERDPALLEWAGWNLIRTSVFPVPPHGAQRVRVTWEELLAGSTSQGSERLDYVLPRSDFARGPNWSVSIELRSATPLAAIYSPTHELRSLERTAGTARLVATDRGASATGSFRLAVVRGPGPSASVLTYPDPAIGGGYFLLLAAAPPAPSEASLPRDLVLVLDRSGSMAGIPLEQAKQAAQAIVASLRDGERVNIVDFSNGVSRFAEGSVPLDATSRSQAIAYLAALRPSGGTNIHDALLEAMRQPTVPGTLPLCLFLTDGLPTIGRTREADIRALAESSPTGRRVFTVGLGPDVNVPLLDRIADVSRASAIYVASGDQLGDRLGDLAERLKGPVVADLALGAELATGPAPSRIAETLPAKLPDLFRGSTLVVLGQYRGNEPFTLAVRGLAADGKRAISVEVDPRQASTANSFVPRLWASRRIAQLVDAIRQQGADAPGGRLPVDTDPRLKELVGEIVRLSTTFGILTEYTSMLALEGTRLDDWRPLESACADLLNGRAVSQRSGNAAVNQGINWNRQKAEQSLAGTKGYVDASLQQVEAQTLAQCADRNYWKAGNTWTDARLAGRSNSSPDEVVDFGTERHRQLVEELVAEGRQSSLALDGEVLLAHRGKTILVRNSTSSVAHP